MDRTLQYINFNSLVNPSFWHRLTQLKLDVDKLNETERGIWASLGICMNVKKPFIEVDSTSFNNNFDSQALYLPFRGKILNKNTIEQFKECDKNELMQQEAETFLQIIKSVDVLKNPSLLNSFFILSFADLKKYQYYYWFAFPRPISLNISVIDIVNVKNEFTQDKLAKILGAYMVLAPQQQAFFILNSSGDLTCLNEAIDKEVQLPNTYFVFTDVSTTKEVYCLSLQNYITLLIHNEHFKDLLSKTINVLALRFTRCDKELSIETSEIIKVQLPDACGDSGWIGWERNERGYMGPRMANMKNAMDPKHLAETAVDLNLKLMKWRLLPDIDLDKIKSMKCLLLGAGTLGCSVARVLLGWGVRKIDFVDNSTVSYSNPVRQSLYTFEDCVKAKPKAAAAADSLKNIFPGVESTGYNLNILMPGHPVGESLLQQARESFSKLCLLIAQTDVIFLLMDSRESRWLPTMLAQHYGKIVINAALGFDTYLVMRHGITGLKPEACKPIDGYEMIRGDELGCYFCNDVTAPGNSLKDRSLDQQCTVTRPGVSQIAGALAVELAISLTQHPFGPCAPAYYRKHNSAASTSAFDTNLENDCLLGVLPHSIRGFLSNLSQVMPATQRYKQCIACSDSVLEKYKLGGFDFLLEVFQSSKVLEDLTGLSEMYNVDQSEVWDFSEGEHTEDENDD